MDLNLKKSVDTANETLKLGENTDKGYKVLSVTHADDKFSFSFAFFISYSYSNELFVSVFSCLFLFVLVFVLHLSLNTLLQVGSFL